MSIINCEENVGMVTEDEKKEVMNYYERILGLQELLPVLGKESNSGDLDANFYERAVKDLGVTKHKHDEWWNRMANKYCWKGMENGSWRIDFSDNRIYLQHDSAIVESKPN